MNAPVQKKKHSKSKVLWTLYTGLIVGILLIAAGVKLSTLHSAKRAETFFAYDRELLDHIEKASGDEDGASVVLLGNSRMRYAMDYGLREEEIVQNYKDKHFHILQYAWDAARFGFFETLWPHILKAQPDFIVVQDLILTSYPSDATLFDGMSEVLLTGLSSLIKREPSREAWAKQRYSFDVPCFEFQTYGIVQERVQHVAARDRHRLIDNEHLDKARDLIAQALAQGIDVIVLRLPGYDKVLKAYNIPPYVMDTYGLEKRPEPADIFPQIHDRLVWVDYITPPEHEDSFCDLAHYEAPAREAFSQWFLEQLYRLEATVPAKRPRVISSAPGKQE